MIRALLIEDELPAREDLRTLLAAHPDVEIVGEAATIRSARELLARSDYELVFLDINLIGGCTFEIVGGVNPRARVIFTTAYDQFALRAFEVNALDYLLKPIVAVRLAEALRRLGIARTPAAEEPADIDPSQPLQSDDRVFLRSGGRGRFAAVSEIALIVAQDNYSEVTLATGERLLIRRTLSAWETVLPGTHFARVHRTCIVNLAQVQRYDRQGDGALLTVRGAAEPVAASRRTWTDVRARLAELHRNL